MRGSEPRVCLIRPENIPVPIEARHLSRDISASLIPAVVVASDSGCRTAAQTCGADAACGCV
eukprot:357881-Chlamydomonas_euryale.AAC.17